MRVSDDLNEIDRILAFGKEFAVKTPTGEIVPFALTAAQHEILKTLPLVKSRREFLAQQVSDERIRSGRRRILTSAGPLEIPSLAAFGMRTFGSIQDLRIALRAKVTLKMIRQAHEAELAEPGDPQTSSIVGTPEW